MDVPTNRSVKTMAFITALFQATYKKSHNETQAFNARFIMNSTAFAARIQAIFQGYFPLNVKNWIAPETL